MKAGSLAGGEAESVARITPIVTRITEMVWVSVYLEESQSWMKAKVI